jgi:hypothetical protein
MINPDPVSVGGIIFALYPIMILHIPINASMIAFIFTVKDQLLIAAFDKAIIIESDIQALLENEKGVPKFISHPSDSVKFWVAAICCSIIGLVF